MPWISYLTDKEMSFCDPDHEYLLYWNVLLSSSVSLCNSWWLWCDVCLRTLMHPEGGIGIMVMIHLLTEMFVLWISNDNYVYMLNTCLQKWRSYYTVHCMVFADKVVCILLHQYCFIYGEVCLYSVLAEDGTSRQKWVFLHHGIKLSCGCI